MKHSVCRQVNFFVKVVGPTDKTDQPTRQTNRHDRPTDKTNQPTRQTNWQDKPTDKTDQPTTRLLELFWAAKNQFTNVHIPQGSNIHCVIWTLGSQLSPINSPGYHPQSTIAWTTIIHLQGVFFSAPPPPNLTKSQSLYNLNWPPLNFPKYRNL